MLKNPFKNLAFLKKCSTYPPPLKYSYKDIKVNLLKQKSALPTSHTIHSSIIQISNDCYKTKLQKSNDYELIDSICLNVAGRGVAYSKLRR